MSTVTSSQVPVNKSEQEPTIEHVITWIENQMKKGDMAESSGRLSATGLRSIAQQLAEGESSHPQAIHDNMDQLLARWVRRNPEMKSETARSYGSRARGAIKEFLRWGAEPAAYRPRSARPSGGHRVEKKPEEPTKKSSLVVATQAAAEPALKPEPQSVPRAPLTTEHARKVQPGDLRECPLGADRTFQYLPPGGGMKLKDALRVAFHLFTICDDYDPMVPPTQVFMNMQRTEQRTE